jgi:hypothetical protein
MANIQKENVIRVDTDNYTHPGPLIIKAVKYMPGTSAQIRADQSSSGTILWETALTTEFLDSDVCIKAQSGIHVDIAGSAVLYIYIE